MLGIWSSRGQVDADRIGQGAGKGLEQTFDLVMVILAIVAGQVQGHAGVERQGAEELLGQLGFKIADLRGVELGIEDQEGPSGQIDNRLEPGLHPSGSAPGRTGECRACRQGLGPWPGRARCRYPQRYGEPSTCKSPSALTVQVDLGMPGQQDQHVVEKTDTGADVGFALTIEI